MVRDQIACHITWFVPASYRVGLRSSWQHSKGILTFLYCCIQADKYACL